MHKALPRKRGALAGLVGADRPVRRSDAPAFIDGQQVGAFYDAASFGVSAASLAAIRRSFNSA